MKQVTFKGHEWSLCELAYNFVPVWRRKRLALNLALSLRPSAVPPHPSPRPPLQAPPLSLVTVSSLILIHLYSHNKALQFSDNIGKYVTSYVPKLIFLEQLILIAIKFLRSLDMSFFPIYSCNFPLQQLDSTWEVSLINLTILSRHQKYVIKEWYERVCSACVKS